MVGKRANRKEAAILGESLAAVVSLLGIGTAAVGDESELAVEQYKNWPLAMNQKLAIGNSVTTLPLALP